MRLKAGGTLTAGGWRPGTGPRPHALALSSSLPLETPAVPDSSFHPGSGSQGHGAPLGGLSRELENAISLASAPSLPKLLKEHSPNPTELPREAFSLREAVEEVCV